MKSALNLFSSLILALFISCIYWSLSFADVNLPWSTTYNCPDWSEPNSLGCDGLSNGGEWTCNPGSYEEQITSAANYSGGGGGKGQRHWKGDGYDNNSAGLLIVFKTTQPEIWFRWYMRYQTGFQWSTLNNDKIIHCFDNTGAQFVVEWGTGPDKARFEVGGTPYESSAGNGWNTVMGGSVSDGQWHLYEFHVSFPAGVGDIWIDGVQRLHKTGMNFSGKTGLKRILIGSNQIYPNNGGCLYVDFDDIAISNTGYIGTLAPPSPPQNLRIISP